MRLRVLFKFLMIWIFANCGNPGNTPEQAITPFFNPFEGPKKDLIGTLVDSTGSQTAMPGWIVFIVSQEGLGQIAEVSQTGTFQFQKIRGDGIYTLILLSAEYVIQSILTFPSDTPKTVKNYFSTSSTTLPQLVQKGRVLQMPALNNILIHSHESVDDDSDGVPDFIRDFEKKGKPIQLTSGDYLPDFKETLGDRIFRYGLSYANIQIITKYTSLTELTRSLNFQAKADQTVAIQNLTVRAYDKTIKEAKSSDTDSVWDKTLLDDGKNEDIQSKDFIYGRKITLATSEKIQPFQMFFFHLEAPDTTFVDFPFTVPNVETGSISVSFDTSSLTATLVGEPFVGLTDYKWVLTFYDSNQNKVFETQDQLSSTKTYTINKSLFSSGSFTIRASAKILEKISGLPIFTVQSPATAFSF